VVPWSIDSCQRVYFIFNADPTPYFLHRTTSSNGTSPFAGRAVPRSKAVSTTVGSCCRPSIPSNRPTSCGSRYATLPLCCACLSCRWFLTHSFDCKPSPTVGSTWEPRSALPSRRTTQNTGSPRGAVRPSASVHTRYSPTNSQHAHAHAHAHARTQFVQRWWR
jgi:hypothetical protein